MYEDINSLCGIPGPKHYSYNKHRDSITRVFIFIIFLEQILLLPADMSSKDLDFLLCVKLFIPIYCLYSPPRIDIIPHVRTHSSIINIKSLRRWSNLQPALGMTIPVKASS
jgi:hypothetical protein